MDDLNDPFGDRVMKNVPPLARFPLKESEIWHQSGEYSMSIEWAGLVFPCIFCPHLPRVSDFKLSGASR